MISIPTSAMKPIAAVNEMLLPVIDQHHDAAEHAERHDRQHDERRFEAAELEHEDGEDAEHGHDDRRADAAECLFARLRLAAHRVVIAARPGHRVQPPHHFRGHLGSVVAAHDVGVDRRRALAIIALDLDRCASELQRRELRDRQTSGRSSVGTRT